MSEIVTLPATVHGRILVATPAGQSGAGSLPLLVGFHGYGENAQRHLDELAAIPGAEAWVCAAVQGLHRFYNAKTGEVVASWMTKEDRELAIADNLAYVGAAVTELRGRTGAGGPLVYAGFSQGVAMAYRAAAGAGHETSAVIAVGGDLPPELADNGLAASGRQPRVLVARGASDPWYTAEKMAADLAVLGRHETPVETVVYEGGHVWTEALRVEVGRFLASLSRF